MGTRAGYARRVGVPHADEQFVRHGAGKRKAAPRIEVPLSYCAAGRALDGPALTASRGMKRLERFAATPVGHAGKGAAPPLAGMRVASASA